MAIDAGIYAQQQQPQFESPINALAKAQSLQNAQNQNKLFGMQVEDRETERAGTNALNSAYQKAYNPETGQVDRNQLYQSIAESGQGSKLPGIQKGYAEQDKSTAEAEKSKLSLALEKQKAVAQVAGSVRDQATWDQGLQYLQSIGVDVSQVPRQYDPATAAMLRDRAMTGAQQLEQVWKQKEYDYKAQNDQQQRQVTMRGQDMTDVRARDLNATKVEENNIKRQAKQETADLTKQSQIASFDTMLGTLGRIAGHPGLARSVGVTGAFPTMPGSDSANFQAELESFKSQAFIPMVSQLKGMGALSDAEGKKLTAAVGALDPKMGETAFRESVGRIMADMEAAKQRVMGGGQANTSNTQPTKKVDVGGKSMDAKLAPDGKYYVKQANGKWAEVVE